jgi:hypothetical protein
LAINGTIARPASGSAHHQPSLALSPSPVSKIADRNAQTAVWRVSASSAVELRSNPSLETDQDRHDDE